MLRPFTLALMLCGLVNAATAQTADTVPETVAPETAPSATANSQQDIGTLQAELASVEAERQRLADQLAAGGESESVGHERCAVESKNAVTQGYRHGPVRLQGVGKLHAEYAVPGPILNR